MAPEILSATINAVKYRPNLSLILIGYYSASKPSILFHDIDTFIFYRRRTIEGNAELRTFGLTMSVPRIHVF